MAAAVSEHTAGARVDQAGYRREPLRRLPIPSPIRGAEKRPGKFIKRCCRLEELLESKCRRRPRVVFSAWHEDTIRRERDRERAGVFGLRGTGSRAPPRPTSSAPNRASFWRTGVRGGRGGGIAFEAAASCRADPRATSGGFSRRSGDVGVTRDDLSGPLRPAARGVGPAGQDRAAYRPCSAKTAGPQGNWPR